MKFYKVTLFLFLAIVGKSQDRCIASKILSPDQLQETENAVKLFWKWDNIKEPEEAVERLAAIAEKDQKNWVAPYWASYILTQLSNQREDNSDRMSELNKAQAFFDAASKIHNDDADKCFAPYFHALQNLIYTLNSFAHKNVDDLDKAALFSEKAKAELNAGIKSDVNNPVLMVLAGTSMASNHNGDFSQIMGAIALLESAKAKFAGIKNRNPVDIGYINEHWVDNWLNRLHPPKNPE